MTAGDRTSFLKDEMGATAIEYALIAALIALFIVGSVSAVGDSLIGVFTDPTLTNALSTAGN
jgi:pilus assembly protein Flp/PilA